MPSKTEAVTITAPGAQIHGDLTLPSGATGVVIFAHGSGSGRASPRNREVARFLEDGGLGTLLIDLLSEEEAVADAETGEFRFDIPRLAKRVVAAIDGLVGRNDLAHRPIGLYGASTGGAAALVAAAERPEPIRGLVLRGARSDLAADRASLVRAPTLFLVGERDPQVRKWNEATRRRMSAPTELRVIRGASHLFEEPGALAEVARATREWFVRAFADR